MSKEQALPRIDSHVSALLALAERCEREADGFYLDKDILRALGYTWRGMAYWYKDDSHPWPRTPTNFTSSLDAAVTLVPEGWEWLRKSAGTMTVYQAPSDKEWAFHYSAAGQPALALCAAALKARAAIAEQEQAEKQRYEVNQ